MQVAKFHACASHLRRRPTDQGKRFYLESGLPLAVAQAMKEHFSAISDGFRVISQILIIF